MEKQVEYYNESIFEKIKYHLSIAKSSIFIAIAWITDDEILEILCTKASEKLEVTIIISNTDISKHNIYKFENLIGAGGKVFYSGKTDYQNEGLMHKKTAIIDCSIILTGSSNWSRQARKNDEDLFIIQNSDVISKNITSFNDLLMNSIPVKLIESDSIINSDNHSEYVRVSKIISGLSNEWKINLLISSTLSGLLYSDFNKARSFEALYYKKEKNYQILFEEIYNVNLNNLTFTVEDFFLYQELGSVFICFEKDIDNIDLLNEFQNLQQIDLSETLIESIDVLSNSIYLEKVNISETIISDLTPLSSCNYLKELICSNTAIKTLSSIKKIETLEVLDISKSLIKDISCIYGSNLEVLDITDTKVSSIKNINLSKLNLLYTNKIIPQNEINDLKNTNPNLLITEKYDEIDTDNSENDLPF